MEREEGGGFAGREDEEGCVCGWVGGWVGWVGGWLGIHRKVEEKEAVCMRCWMVWVGRWGGRGGGLNEVLESMGGWVGGLGVSCWTLWVLRR